MVVTGIHAGDLTRVVYHDEITAKLPRALVEDAYGCKFQILPLTGDPPKKPKKVGGVVLHVDPDFDSQYVVGDRHPFQQWQKLKLEISRQFPGVGDIDDKWHEYNFLKRAAPGVAPPPMKLGRHFDPAKASKQDRARVQEKVRGAMKQRGLTAKGLEKETVDLELLREAVQKDLGRSILKIRLANHSEGNLPRTDTDWIDTYLGYMSETRKKVEQVEKDVAGSSVNMEEKILELPYIEGRVLRQLIDDPELVAVQQMVEIEEEMRMHVLEGQVLRGATFLRFYPLGEVLTPDETAAVEGAIQHEFLDKMPRKLKKMCFTPDMIREKGGRIRILDFNCGIESGYYYPTEDMITSNLLARQLRGTTTPLLEELRAIEDAPSDREQASRIRAFRTKYKDFLKGDVQESVWDRVITMMCRRIARDPRPATYLAVLRVLDEAGMEEEFNFIQLVSQVQIRWPSLRLPAAERQRWLRNIDARDEWIDTRLVDGRFTWVDLEELEEEEED